MLEGKYFYLNFKVLHIYDRLFAVPEIVEKQFIGDYEVNTLGIYYYPTKSALIKALLKDKVIRKNYYFTDKNVKYIFTEEYLKKLV